MDYPTARLCLLRENGEAASLAGARVDPRAARTLVLSRALCRFQSFTTPPGITGAAAERAARLFAETHAPFAATESALWRTPAGFAIWQWDAEQIRALTPGWRYAPEAIVPDTLLAPRGEGWRQVETAEGFEAQYWQAGVLAASMWRRRPFTDANWAAFVLTVDEAAIEAPAHPPQPERLALDEAADWRKNRVHERFTWKQAEQAAFTLALCAAAIAAVFTGQAAHYESARSQDVAAMEAASETESTDIAAARGRANIALVRAYAAARPSPNPLGAAAEALQVLEAHGLRPTDWEAAPTAITIAVAAPDGASVEEAAYALEQLPNLSAVTPRFEGDDGAIVITAELAK